MHIRLLPLLAATMLLSACGNKADLLQPREVPPEDRGRYIFKSSIPTREQLEAEDAAAWDEDDAATTDQVEEVEVEVDRGAEVEEVEEVDVEEVTTPPAVPVILDVPPATGTP
ncbi:hypothetical protein [Luteimonas sp. 100069]|uniref:hypothetical protein n=1 Tax=Luteimonas sp. 100069 TaxID=2006109 RepID=UPI000F4F8363|nr:hypothetical protein [Luteimonas sp. 100069]RPD83817.1 hypothetical protein EGK76_13785 [Luteimonas sp. 100069]